MHKISAGLLLYRLRNRKPEFFLVHPGGPFWTKRDLGSWSIPKGEVAPGEENDLLATAQRELKEETGCAASGKFIPLKPVKLRSGKIIHAWAVQGDCDASGITSNTFSMEWPPHSGKKQEFPEVDRADWFNFEDAKKKINEGQLNLLQELREVLAGMGMTRF